MFREFSLIAMCMRIISQQFSKNLCFPQAFTFYYCETDEHCSIYSKDIKMDLPFFKPDGADRCVHLSQIVQIKFLSVARINHVKSVVKNAISTLSILAFCDMMIAYSSFFKGL